MEYVELVREGKYAETFWIGGIKKAELMIVCLKSKSFP